MSVSAADIPHEPLARSISGLKFVSAITRTPDRFSVCRVPTVSGHGVRCRYASSRRHSSSGVSSSFIEFAE
jgi:hypothetical protein